MHTGIIRFNLLPGRMPKYGTQIHTLNRMGYSPALHITIKPAFSMIWRLCICAMIALGNAELRERPSCLNPPSMVAANPNKAEKSEPQARAMAEVSAKYSLGYGEQVAGESPTSLALTSIPRYGVGSSVFLNSNSFIKFPSPSSRTIEKCKCKPVGLSGSAE